MKRTIILACVVAGLTASFSFAFGVANQKVESISLMQLIVNPEKHHGKLVRVIGTSRIEFEGNSIWFTKEHDKHRIYKNAPWIDPDYQVLQATPQQLEKFNGKYILMEGVCNKDDRGHMGMNSGTLKDVTRFQLWEK